MVEDEKWRDLHNCTNPKYHKQTKSRRLMWVGYVARMGEGRKVKNFSGKPEGKSYLGDRGVDGCMGKIWTLVR
jgi:hypothetical protein